jgi:hypothetical protein
MSSNGMSAQNVIAILRSIAQEDSTLQITKPFRGMLLSQDARILAITPNSVVLQAADVRMGFTSGTSIYLNSKLLPMPVMAQLSGVSVLNNTFIVSDFIYKEEGWKERVHERVHPKEPTYAILNWSKKSFRTSLEDISCQGIGLLAYKVLEKGFNIQSNSEILLDFQLSPNYRLSALRGRIIYHRALGKSFSRIGVQIHPNLGQSHLLKQYIVSQKVEIGSELDQIFNQAIREPDVVDQFF